MAAITLPRSNARPLAFEGRLVSKISSKALSGSLALRWNEIAIYSANENYVVSISYRSKVRFERAEYVVATCAGVEEIVKELRTYGPGVHFCAEVQNVDEYLAQARIYSEIRAEYYRMVNELVAWNEFASGRGQVHIDEA